MFKDIRLFNESDVEQKFVYPLLTSNVPFGLNYQEFNIRTKPNIRAFLIDKGRSEKYYFPDYLILLNSIPSIVVEVKGPNEDIYNAYREARLYASEINSSYSTKINPCSKIIVTNGNKTIAGEWDSGTYKFEFSINDCESTNPIFSKFIEEYCFDSVSNIVEKLKLILRSNTKYHKPTSLLGGRVVRGESIPDNSFGSNLALEYQYLFNPETQEDREKIILNAYVESRKRLAHVNPIDKLIRSIVTPSKFNSNEFQDTSSPIELANRLRDNGKSRKQICLLIGSVGAGKSTFVDYLKTKALPNELLSETAWLSLNLNDAPINTSLIYNWTLEKIIASIHEQNKDIDFEEIEFLKKIFAREISTFDKGIGKLLSSNSIEYNKELYLLLKKLSEDKTQYLKQILQYCYNGKEKLPIIVLDNCDKRNRDEQLLMFQVAHWLKDNFNSMIFLPIRETTYDLYKDEPPLDTVVKEFTFRIDPPLLINVISKRIDYALREIAHQQSNFYFHLPNGARVSCKRSEVGNYLKCILHNLFQESFFKMLITGIAGRNIRKGLEIFLDFCKSGFFTEDYIFRMRTQGSKVQIPPYLISKIIFRGNRRFYDEKASRIKNVFFSDPEADIVPDPFIRYSILDWLYDKQKEKGPTQVKGYHLTSSLIFDLVAVGHDEKRLIIELEELMLNDYIISETQEHKYNPENLISITSSGVILVDLLSNIEYLSTIAEDTYYRNLEDSRSIALNITSKGKNKIERTITIANAEILVQSLKNYKEKFWITTDRIIKLKTDRIEALLKHQIGLVQKWKSNSVNYIDFKKIADSNPPGTIVRVQVAHIEDYGIFVDLGNNVFGLIEKNSIFRGDTSRKIYEEFEPGDWVEAEVIQFNIHHRKFDLKYINLA